MRLIATDLENTVFAYKCRLMWLCIKVLLLFQSGKVAKYCDQRFCLFVCLFCLFVVCLSARISQKPHVQISPNFYMLFMAVVRFCADCNTIGLHYVLPVLWMTSYLT